MNTAEVYRMDEDAFWRLTDWCDQELRADRARDARNQIKAALEAMPAEEARHMLSAGWRHIYNRMAF